MAQLAIKGHATRGREVIELLEMLGGINKYNLQGNEDEWFILNENLIQYSDKLFAKKGFTLEEFLEKFPYKVGDKVQSKSAKSYDPVYIIEYMTWVNNRIEYKVKPSYDLNHTTGLVPLYVEDLKPYKEEIREENINYCKIGKITSVIFHEKNYEDKVELDLGNNYEIKVEDGKTYVVRKKLQYPKTYGECCDILTCCRYTKLKVSVMFPYDAETIPLLENIRKLRVCRDAYWKIAGKEMGLNEPWEPDWKSSDLKYGIKTIEDEVNESIECTINCFLVFPTEKMRDVFFENFNDLIEQCKELL